MSAATAARQGRVMPQLVRWHLGLGELALRLFLLQLLWVLGTLAGALVLGALPATAAVCAVLREDRLEQIAEEAGEPPRAGRRLWSDFWGAWRAEFWRSHRLGGALLLAWLVLSLDRWILAGTELGAQLGLATPLASGVVVALTVVLVLLSAVVWPLAAHFSDPLPRLLRMGLVLLARRPALSLSLALVLMAAVWLAQTVPGLVPVFGLSLPAWVVTALLWRSGTMPLSPRASEAPPE